MFLNYEQKNKYLHSDRFQSVWTFWLLSPEAVARGCSVKSSKFVAQVFSIEFCEISKNTFSNGTPPVAASVPQNVLTFDVVERRICFTHSWKSK